MPPNSKGFWAGVGAECFAGDCDKARKRPHISLQTLSNDSETDRGAMLVALVSGPQRGPYLALGDHEQGEAIHAAIIGYNAALRERIAAPPAGCAHGHARRTTAADRLRERGHGLLCDCDACVSDSREQVHGCGLCKECTWLLSSPTTLAARRTGAGIGSCCAQRPKDCCTVPGTRSSTRFKARAQGPTGAEKFDFRKS